jgi:hypothetical protein
MGLTEEQQSSLYVALRQKMKPRRNILVALFSFCLVSDASIVSASGVVPKRFFPKSPIGICNLIKHPSQYAGKTIRLKAVLVENHTPRIDGGDPYLYGPACRKTPFSVVVEFVSQESYQPLEILGQKPDLDGYVRSNVILVGAFHYLGTEKYGHLNWADAKFVIHKVEEVKGTAAKTPWRR